MGGTHRKKKRSGTETGAEVVPLRPARPPARPALAPPSAEQVELTLAEMAARVCEAAAIPEAEKAQLGLLSDLLRPKAAFVTHYVPHRRRLQVTLVRGRNDPRISADLPGRG